MKRVLGASLCVAALLLAGCSKEVEIPQEVASGQIRTEDIPAINPSAVVEMVIPDVGIRASFDDEPCRVKKGAIDPKSMNNACVYTDPERPYTLPGTNSPDLVVIAGHTGAGVPAVFNNLYDGKDDKHTISEGAKLYIRTVASEDSWLVYRATDFHSPQKESLVDDTSIWGTDATPGRLLTISCVQPANPLADSVRNAVVGWQFEGVAGGEGLALSTTASATPTSTVVNSSTAVVSSEESAPVSPAPAPVAPAPSSARAPLAPVAPAPAPVAPAPAPVAPAPAPAPEVPVVPELPALPPLPELPPPPQLPPLPELPPLPVIQIP